MTWLAAGAVVLCMLLAYAGVSLSAFLIAFGLVAVTAWCVAPQTAVWFYFATLCIQVPQGHFQFRFAIADCFLLPLIARAALAIWRGRRPDWPLLRPLLVIGLALLVASGVAYARLGFLSSWALLNKDAGFLFLLAGFVALTFQLKTQQDVDRAIDVFVVSVSVATMLALVVGLAGEFFWRDFNVIYPGLIRFYGFLLNPTSQGSLLMIALLLELPRLSMQGRRPARWRIANYSILLLALMVTLSRSTWLALAAASAGLALVLIARRLRSASAIPWRAVSAAAVTAAVPVAALAGIAFVQWRSVRDVRENQSTSQAASLRERVLDICAVKYDPELCRDLPAAEIVKAKRRVAAARAGMPELDPGAPLETTPLGAPLPSLSNPDGAAMNSRGLSDRAAIIRLAMKPYRESLKTRVLGIGLGTFYATSGADFGVPVIIHSTPAWFLIELGVLGAAGLAWLMAASIGPALKATLDGDRFWSIAPGVFAALTGWLFLSVLNESFYFRHFWLLLVLSDVLIRLRREPA
jgi:hypothetical protein